MDKTLICKVCEDYPPEVISQINSMLFLANATMTSIRKYVKEDMRLNPPSNDMIKRHKERMHHLPNGGMLTQAENDALAKINAKNDMQLFNHITTQITVRTLPKLAMINENINVLEEKQELYFVIKNELAMELESIRSRPIIVENHDGDEIAISPLTKNAKELMRLSSTQLDSIEKTMSATDNIKIDVTEDLIFAFMQALGKSKMSINQAVKSVYEAEGERLLEVQAKKIIDDNVIKEIDIEDISTVSDEA